MNIEDMEMEQGVGVDAREYRSRQRRRQAAQSAIVAIIVLFLLLFLAGIFIAIIAGNIKNAQRMATTSAAGRFAEAGIKYLDEQLSRSPEGADWRSVPDCLHLNAGGTLPCSNTAISPSDPDYYWLKPCGAPGAAAGEPCGYTRVNFGGPTPSQGNIGGRALVKITYTPNNPNDPLSRYIKLDSVGRAGQVDPADPTTYKNSESLGQRVELVAYKGINLNEFVMQVTNKDSRPGPFNIGAPYPVRDRGALRNVETFFNGPVRVNGGVNFFGINRFLLNPYRGDALQVAGTISMNGVNNNGDSTATDPSRVLVSTVGLPTNLLNQQLNPSGSPNFRTLGPEVAQQAGTGMPALVRDNPHGADVLGLPRSVDDYGNFYENLRSVGRITPPTIDEVIGASGTTRYRELTRNAPPMAPQYVTANPIPAGVRGFAGNIGWGANLYISNTNDIQRESETLTGGYSLRGDWLSNAGRASYGQDTFWRGDAIYVPPAVTITLYPRYFTIENYTNANQRQTYQFRTPAGGRLRDARRILRYTAVQGAGVPVGYGTGVDNPLKFEGYPADADPSVGNVYNGEFVIYAEGNIRIRGVAGGLDRETGAFFKRHLTVVSGGTIYVDGNLLRDNITSEARAVNATAADAVAGKSTIALLAKQYVCVNTTQFLNPDNQGYETERQAEGGIDPFAFKLRIDPQTGKQFNFRTNFAPLFDPVAGFQTPGYLTGAADYVAPSLFLRHKAANAGGTVINAFVNERPGGTPNNGAGYARGNYLDFGPLGLLDDPPGFPDPYTLALARSAQPEIPPVYFDDRFDIPLAYLYPTNPYPAALLSTGQDNFMGIVLDTVSGSNVDYLFSRFGVAPLDIRIEALMYAQEGSFFIIPGPWFNPNPNDTYENFVDPASPTAGKRAEDDNAASPRRRVNERFPFYKEPMDIRITFCGAINQNLPAEIADQGAWMEKWGWIPQFYGSTGLAEGANSPDQGNQIATVHGRSGPLPVVFDPNSASSGIVYEFDDRALRPYAPFGPSAGTPLRPNPYNPTEPLPFAPRLPVAPGLLYFGQNPVQP
jgi:hypothetical protein